MFNILYEDNGVKSSFIDEKKCVYMVYANYFYIHNSIFRMEAKIKILRTPD